MRTALFIGAGLLVGGGLWWLAGAPAEVSVITWSSSQAQLALSVGQNRNSTITFTSGQTLNNVIIEPTPGLAPFVTIQPQFIPNVPAHAAQSISVTFTASQTTAVGTYEGTIHVRSGNKTYPQTLKVSIQVVNPLGSGLATLVQRDSLIVLGTVSFVHSSLSQSGASIYTDISLLINQVVRGSLPFGSSSVNIRVSGGTVGSISSVEAGSPTFTVGESVIVFLNGPDALGNYSLPDQALGTFHLENDPALGQIVVIDQAYLQMETMEVRAPDFQQFITTSSQKLLTLAAFLSAVNASP